jgi:hypothetical protein
VPPTIVAMKLRCDAAVVAMGAAFAGAGGGAFAAAGGGAGAGAGCAGALTSKVA